MVLEWLRRKDPAFDHELKTYLFTEGKITELEEGEEEDNSEAMGSDESLGIGSLKEGN